MGVSSDGVYTINKQPVEGVGIEVLTNALSAAAQGDAGGMLKSAVPSHSRIPPCFSSGKTRCVRAFTETFF